MTGSEIRSERAKAGISVDLLAMRAGIERTRVTRIELGYVEPRPEEAERLRAALDDLADAREKVAAVAAEVGWPM
jgi:transcriptional regulator with XRE-family HTH domain